MDETCDGDSSGDTQGNGFRRYLRLALPKFDDKLDERGKG